MTTAQSSDVVWHDTAITKIDRQRVNGHKSFIVWLTGLSGSGKSTIANELSVQLFNKKYNSYVLDGDNVRHGLNSNLGFSETDRVENIRRIGEVAKLFVDAGTIVITAFISPYEKDRQLVRQLVEREEFIEVFVQCDLSLCEQRDPKGLYKKARNGDIQNFTGISAPYEEPVNPELIIDTEHLSVEEAVQSIITYLEQHGYLAHVGNIERGT